MSHIPQKRTSFEGEFFRVGEYEPFDDRVTLAVRLPVSVDHLLKVIDLVREIYNDEATMQVKNGFMTFIPGHTDDSIDLRG